MVLGKYSQGSKLEEDIARLSYGATASVSHLNEADDRHHVILAKFIARVRVTEIEPNVL
jgi:hypothetical protein